MAARARLIERLDMRADCARVSAPTLVVTGEAHLDHVVPAKGSTEYVQLIKGARSAILERTGHTGTMTRPDAFATLVRDFVSTQVGADPRVGPGRTRGSAPTPPRAPGS